MMKKLLVAFACGLSFCIGLASAQVIVRSVQLSQDPSGVIGVDASNHLYVVNGRHLLVPAASNVGPPALTSCGATPSPTITGTDLSFKLTTGGTATTCTITFAVPFVTAPQCFLQANGSATQPTYTTSTTAITVTVDIAQTVYSGLCLSVS